MVDYTCNPITWEVETEGIRIQRYPQLHSEFKGSLGRLCPCLKTSNYKQREKGKKEEDVENGEDKKDLIWPLLDAGSEASLQIACSQGEQGAHEAEGTFVV